MQLGKEPPARRRRIGKRFLHRFGREFLGWSVILATGDPIAIETKCRNQPVLGLLRMEQNRPCEQLPHDILGGGVAVKEERILPAVKLRVPTCSLGV